MWDTASVPGGKTWLPTSEGTQWGELDSLEEAQGCCDSSVAHVQLATLKTSLYEEAPGSCKGFRHLSPLLAGPSNPRASPFPLGKQTQGRADGRRSRSWLWSLTFFLAGSYVFHIIFHRFSQLTIKLGAGTVGQDTFLPLYAPSLRANSVFCKFQWQFPCFSREKKNQFCSRLAAELHFSTLTHWHKRK